MFSIAYIIVFVFFFVFLFLAFRLKKFQEKGFDKTVDYTEYNPPKDLNAYEIGYLIDSKFNGRDIGAAAISFYKKGLLKIAHSKLFSAYNYYFELDREYGVHDGHEVFHILFKKSFEGSYYVRFNLSPKTLSKIKKRVQNHLCDTGYLKKEFLFKKASTIILFVLIFSSYFYFAIKNPFGFDSKLLFKTLYFFMVPTLIVLFVKQERLSKKGLTTRRELRGFKEYLEKVELPRILEKIHDYETPQEKIENIPHLEYFVAFDLIPLRKILD